MMKDAHFAILDLLMTGPPEWMVVPMMMNRDYGRGWASGRVIAGRRARLKELNDLGLIGVRTVTISEWHSPLSDRLKDGYDRVEVQAMLTPQGRDVALSKRADGTSAKGGA